MQIFGLYICRKSRRNGYSTTSDWKTRQNSTRKSLVANWNAYFANIYYCLFRWCIFTKHLFFIFSIKLTDFVFILGIKRSITWLSYSISFISRHWTRYKVDWIIIHQINIDLYSFSYCGFIIHCADNSFKCHVFYCQSSCVQLCKDIEAACKVSWTKQKKEENSSSFFFLFD